MPIKKTPKKRKSAATQAGSFVREEIEHIRRGLHGARNVKQAIAIGLSKARKAGVPLPARGKSTTRRKKLSAARRASVPSATRSRAISAVLRREPRSTVSRAALAKQARSSARKRGPVARRASAKRAVRTKGPLVRQQAARKAARTRQARRRVG